MWEVFDLDGTLVGLETRFILRLRLILWRPFKIRKWCQAKRISSQAEKIFLHSCVPLSVEHLPYNVQVVASLHRVSADKSGVILATASSHQLAESVAAFLGGIDVVLGSSNAKNLKGDVKLRAIQEVLGSAQFRYWGNSSSDLAIWEAASAGCLVLGRAAKKIDPGVRSGLAATPNASASERIRGFMLLLFLPPRRGAISTRLKQNSLEEGDQVELE